MTPTGMPGRLHRLWIGACATVAPLAACGAHHASSLATAPPASTAPPAASAPPSASATPPAADAAPAAAPANAPMATARRVIGPAAKSRATAVLMGDGWGCAAFESEAGKTWECWEPGHAPVAWSVPWLHNHGLHAGPDRLCDFTPPGLTFRCWFHPLRGETSGRELPATWEWLNPNGAGWQDAYSRSDRIGPVFVGGTFGCVQETRHQGVWCLGEDGFGQLGGSKPVPPAQAPREDSSFLRGIWPAGRVALGTWHGCAIAGAVSSGAARVACWGRVDHGQLGVPTPDRCTVGGVSAACARTPQIGPAITDGLAALAAGDLFTCVSTRDGISCWGASRDGFFGAPASCPASLRAAWPTLHGATTAPRASCSPRPSPVADVHGFQQWMQAGPRGLCFDEEPGGARCVGGVPSPRGGGVRGVAISLGQDASACGLKDGDVVCWGQGYSPKESPDEPVSVSFEAGSASVETAVVGSTDVSRWTDNCVLRRGCTLTTAPLATCDQSVAAKSLSEVLASADAVAGQTVAVRGLLGVGSTFMTMAACVSSDGRDCCANHARGQVVLGGAQGNVALGGLYCAGDDSAQCCNAPAYGQGVVATGRLDRAPHASGPDAKWMLSGATLCEDKKP